MIRRAILFLSLASLVSCGGGSGGTDAHSSADSPANKEKPKGNASSSVKIEGDAQRRAGITVVRVQPVSVAKYFTASGQIVVNEERTSHIGTYTDGRVTEVHANVGDPVRRGMVLARMHSHDVHETRAAYYTALQDVKKQEAAVAYQQQLLDRMQRLFQLKSASRQEVDKAESDLHAAQADVANARIAVEKEVAHLTDILHLPESALNDINETTEQVPVIAPAPGIVVARNITLGSVVEPGQEVYTVTDLRSVWMMASVNESDISKVRVGERAAVLTQAFPSEQFKGTVIALGTELDSKTRTLQAKILIPNGKLQIRPGMYASAQLSQGDSRPALFVSEEALQDLNGGSIVFVRTLENTFEPRPVEVAERLHGQAQINAGLRSGDAVVVKGSFVVKSEMLKSQIGE